MNLFVSINFSAIYVAKCWPILLHFWLGNHCSFCFIHCCPRVQLSKSIQWLELHFILFYHLSLLYSCWPHQTCTRIRNWTSLLLGAFRVLGIWNFKNKQQNPRNTATPRNPTHSNGNFWMSRSLCAIPISDWMFQTFFWKRMWVCEIVLHANHVLASAELTAVGRGCSTAAVRAPL